MAEFHEECKKWINLIQKLELDHAAAALKGFIKFKNDEVTSKYLFKVLLHLSHAADKCYREKLSKEIQVFTIANVVCKNLKTVLDKNNFFSAIFYVIYYLLKSQYYEEAKIITAYLFPGRLVDLNDKFEASKYHKIAVLWQAELIKKLDNLIANFKKEKKVDEEVFKYSLFHFEILNFCAEESSGYILRTAEMYVQKSLTIPLNVTFPYLLQYLKRCFKNLKSNSIEVYNSVVVIVACAFFKRNDATNNPNILNYFRQCDTLFLDSLKGSAQCYDCYEFFRSYSLNLFETNFMTKEIGERYEKSLKIIKNLLEKYGSKNATLQETVAAVALSFEIHFSNLENLVGRQLKGSNISYEDILKLGDFMKLIFSILKSRPINYVCKKCPATQKCLMKYDIYNASIGITSYMKVISKYSNERVDEKFFSTAKELMGELEMAFNEVDKSGCKYSSALWDSFGRIIFNIGLISEAKFPAGLEQFYEVLCKQIVCRDGLNSKLSSFGLENPVGTSLHRLCNANFNQEKYRKAMSYTAYNALLSNLENRKKKAYDMWANIKLKMIDSKQEIPELTLLSCLRLDHAIVEKLGIRVDLEKYDLSDVCLRELNSLFMIKSNMLSSMKTTLGELESMGDDLTYSKGVLLLCFHALQLNKREYIVEFIKKALDKLRNYKPKTASTQCLIANLNFFNIVEKLYARNQAISKQMEEANFTIKAFKTWKGKQLFDGNENENENENEVVPTYGGINIDEDNRLAKELKNIVNMWESCIDNNAAAVSLSWEPQYTLETIIICGEYCRLYKFDYVERNLWVIAHKLATELKDSTTCIYVTSRCISLRFINESWINDSENYAEKLKNSSKSNETDTVILFWLSLADFYLDCKKIVEAKVLLEKAKTMPNHKILNNTKLYIYSVDIHLRNYFIISPKPSQEDYFQFLVEIHYSMINLHDVVTQEVCRFWQLRFQLLACEQIFNVMCNVIIPMNSLLSYREVSAHLVYGMKVAQTLGMTLRIAEFLKYLCYIDLLRGKMEDCEIKLQDFEHILCLENFQVSMKTKLKNKTSTQNIPLHRIRDASSAIPINMSKNKASPELKKKIFSAPNFISHTTHCNCFFCSNISYQYLTFSCSHIRAQLYSLMNYTSESHLHFQGALNIKSRMDEIDSDKARQCKNYQWKRNQSYTVDGLMCLLDYAVYLIDFYPKQQDDALTLIEEIMDIAVKNDLFQHYVYNYANELYLQHFMYNQFQDKMSSIFVPDDIPITITNQPADGCITPKQLIEKTSQSLRRKTPPAVAIPKITIELTSDEENTAIVDNRCEFLEPADIQVVKKTKKTGTRSVRRKILVDECEENGSQVENVQRRSTRSMKKKTS